MHTTQYTSGPKQIKLEKKQMDPKSLESKGVVGAS